MRPVVYVATSHDWHGYQHFYQGLAHAFTKTRPLLYVGGVTNGPSTLTQVSDQMWLLNTRVPRGASRRLLRPLRDRLLARAIRRSMTELQWTASPIIWTYTTDAAPLLRQLPTAPSVYWTGDEVIDPFEPALLRAVKQVFTVSPASTREKRSLRLSAPVTEMPMAVDPSPYEAAAASRTTPADIADLPRPWFGYGGAVNARTDWELVDQLAASTDGTVLIIGPPNDAEGERQTARTDHPRNVVFLGHRDATEAPAYLAALDVGLIPYTLSAFNIGSNPTKTYDYLAAGVPVIATDLPAIHPLQPQVTVTGSRDEFVAAALSTAAKPSTNRARSERQALARRYSYDALVQRVDEVLGDAVRLP